MRLLMLCGLVLLSTFSPAFAQHVIIQSGNVVYVDRGGGAHRLTGNGRDSQPTLSADGFAVAFVREVREVSGIGVPSVMQSELWIIGTGPGATAKRVYAGPATVPDGRQSSAFWTPKFSPDKRYLYFLTDYAATSHALFRLDLGTATARFLSSAIDYDVVQRGRHKGCIIANIRTSSEPDGDGNTFPIYPYFMLDSNGRKLSRVADQSAKLDDVVARFQR